jgi:hypothetical protein
VIDMDAFEDDRAAEILSDAHALITGQETAEERAARLARSKARRKARPKPEPAPKDRMTERREAWAKLLATVDHEIAPLLKAGRYRAGFQKVLVEIAGASISAAERADRLEERIAALEAKGEKGTGA